MATRTKRTRIKAPELPVPASLAEAEGVLGRIGSLDRQIRTIEATMNDELAEVKARFEAQAAPHVEEIERLFQGVQAWGEAHRGSLLEKGRKSAKIATGELGWRRTPPKVRITGVDAVIAALKSLKLSRFVRTKEEIDKAAIVKDPEAVEHVKGISITQQEEFWIKPFESEIERSRAKKVGNT